MLKFNELRVAAPSKVILHGEHAVVYGFTAVAASLDLRTRMRISPHASRVAVHFPDVGLENSWSLEQLRSLFSQRPDMGHSRLMEVDQAYLERVLDFLKVDQSDLRMASMVCFLYLYSTMMMEEEEPGIVPMEIWVESDIPLGAGLGSSAALSVCLAAGLMAVRHQVQGLEKNIINYPSSQMRQEICQLAFLSEKILHGTPSGIDNAISAYGGMCTFTKGNHTAVPVGHQLKILLINTNKPRNTKDLLARVKQKYEAYPKIVKPILEAIGELGQNFLDTVAEMDNRSDQEETHYRVLGDLFELNQALLASLGVSHQALDHVCSILRQFGMRGKLTGAGGGGFAIALVPPSVTESTLGSLRTELQTHGYTCSEASIGVPGFSVELVLQI